MAAEPSGGGGEGSGLFGGRWAKISRRWPTWFSFTSGCRFFRKTPKRKVNGTLLTPCLKLAHDFSQ
ncbi:hypothetical protein E2320_011725 [Naja naja]|nr:hypothetical protein E2320_011725 [Naja naja]